MNSNSISSTESEKQLFKSLSVKIAFLLSSTFLISYAFLIFLTTCLFALNISISKFNLLTSMMFGLFYFLYASIKFFHLPTQIILLSFILLASFYTLAYIISGAVLDLSWDGQSYHFQAIKSLIYGWNPILQPKIPESNWYNVILNHYAKASWYLSAAIGIFTQTIEPAKCGNILMILATFGVVYSTVSIFPKLSGGLAILISLLVTANPVCLTQSLNFYNDCQVASILTIVICLMVMFIYFKNLIIQATFVSSIFLAISVKFTSAVYAVLFLLLFILFLKLFPNFNFRFRKKFYILILVSVILSFIVSFQPYVSNLLQHGNPLYPIFGSSTLDMMNGNSPSDFIGKNPLSNLIKSILSPSTNIIAPSFSQIKNPFTVERYEIKIFQAPDVRLGGFGPLFALALILSIIIMLILCFIRRKHWMIIVIPPSILFLLVMINPEGWWARFAPQLWLVPLWILINLLFSEKLLAKIAASVIISIVVFDIALVSIGYYSYNISESNRVKERIHLIQNSPQPILVYLKSFSASRNRLDIAGIRYIAFSSMDFLPCPLPLDPLTYYSPKSCPPQ